MSEKYLFQKNKKATKPTNEQGTRFIPNKTFNITVVDDSTYNLNNYNSTGNGWYTMQVEIKGNSSDKDGTGLNTMALLDGKLHIEYAVAH